MIINLSHVRYTVNRKRIQRMMWLKNLMAIDPQPHASQRNHEHRNLPCLPRVHLVTQPDEIQAADITNTSQVAGDHQLKGDHRLTQSIYSGWRLSNSLESSFCMDVLNEALGRRRSEIFNTDQGVQFTSRSFASRLGSVGVRISMDGKGRALDNVMWWLVPMRRVVDVDLGVVWIAEKHVPLGARRSRVTAAHALIFRPQPPE